MALPSACPRCGGDLQVGHVTGQSFFLNWIPQGDSPGLVAIGKEHLATGNLVRPPMLPAARCGSCGLGLFEVDQ